MNPSIKKHGVGVRNQVLQRAGVIVLYMVRLDHTRRPNTETRINTSDV